MIARNQIIHQSVQSSHPDPWDFTFLILLIMRLFSASYRNSQIWFSHKKRTKVKMRSYGIRLIEIHVCVMFTIGTPFKLSHQVSLTFISISPPSRICRNSLPLHQSQGERAPTQRENVSRQRENARTTSMFLFPSRQYHIHLSCPHHGLVLVSPMNRICDALTALLCIFQSLIADLFLREFNISTFAN